VLSPSRIATENDSLPFCQEQQTSSSSSSSETKKSFAGKERRAWKVTQEAEFSRCEEEFVEGFKGEEESFRHLRRRKRKKIHQLFCLRGGKKGGLLLICPPVLTSKKSGRSKSSEVEKESKPDDALSAAVNSPHFVRLFANLDY